MPFRAKLKRALFSKKTPSASSTPPQRTDIEYYKPGEIPRSKYRGPWNQKHQDNLQAFSFEDATHDRRGSLPPATVSYSPRGTMAQSRRSSWVSRARSSLGGRSGSGSGKTKVEEAPGSGIGGRRKSHASHNHVELVVEGEEDEADVGNVGLSRRATTTEEHQRTSEEVNRLGMEKTFTQGDAKHADEDEGGNAQPLSPDELSKAMTAAATIRADR